MGDEEGREGGKRGGSAAAELLAEHGAGLARVCMALLGDAKEVERVLEQIAREAGAEREVPPAGEARGFLFGLARAACATRHSKLPLRGTQLTGPPAPEPPATERLGARDAKPARALLAKLRPTEREAVVLHAVGGLSADEVAVACGIDGETARTRIAQGMLRLVELSAEAEGGSR